MQIGDGRILTDGGRPVAPAGRRRPCVTFKGRSAVVTRGAATNDSRSDRPRFAGATSDLAYRKIFPALEAMLERGRLDVPVIGAAQGVWSLVTRKCLFPLPWLNHFSRR